MLLIRWTYQKTDMTPLAKGQYLINVLIYLNAIVNHRILKTILNDAQFAV